jgi:hypothetical protein
MSKNKVNADQNQPPNRTSSDFSTSYYNQEKCVKCAMLHTFGCEHKRPTYESIKAKYEEEGKLFQTSRGDTTHRSQMNKEKNGMNGNYKNNTQNRNGKNRNNRNGNNSNNNDQNKGCSCTVL